MKPNFLVIGAARSGTTSLHKYLESHPDSFMSDVKEINFFSNEKYWIKGTKWYEKHFNEARAKAVGEASTSYTNFPVIKNVPKRIYSYIPDVKLLYVLRDPIDRFLSHYLHRVQRGIEDRSIEDIIENYPNDHLLWQGRYYTQLKHYLEFFPQDQIFVTTIDDLKSHPEETVKLIFKFLDIDDSYFNPSFRTRYNVNTDITKKSPFGKKILRFYRENVEQTRIPFSIKKQFQKLSELGAKKIEKPVLTESQLTFLKGFYKEDLSILARDIRIDMSGWKTND